MEDGTEGMDRIMPCQSEFVRATLEVPIKVWLDISFLSYGGLRGRSPLCRSTHTYSFKIDRGLCQLCELLIGGSFFVQRHL